MVQQREAGKDNQGLFLQKLEIPNSQFNSFYEVNLLEMNLIENEL